MIIGEVMNRNTQLITVTPQHNVAEAIKIMKDHKIRHLPVLNEKGKLEGILSDRDLRDASPSILNSDNSDTVHTKISEVMSRNVITITPYDFIEDVAAIFCEFKISCLPVMAEDRLIGIITESDLLRILISITGAAEPSSYIEVKLPHEQNAICRVLGILQTKDIAVSNLLLYPLASEPSNKRLVIRTSTMNTSGIASELSEKGFEVIWPKMKN